MCSSFSERPYVKNTAGYRGRTRPSSRTNGRHLTFIVHALANKSLARTLISRAYGRVPWTHAGHYYVLFWNRNVRNVVVGLGDGGCRVHVTRAIPTSWRASCIVAVEHYCIINPRARGRARYMLQIRGARPIYVRPAGTPRAHRRDNSSITIYDTREEWVGTLNGALHTSASIPPHTRARVS